MIKVKVNKNKITITGHANYAEYGQDIVCASASSIVATSVNLMLRIDEHSIDYQEEKDKVTINIKSRDNNILMVIENMLVVLDELSQAYSKNIKIIKED